MSINKWWSVRPAKDAVAIRLFCFPHVGAGPSIFNNWPAAWAPENVELWGVRLPGREQRLSEMPFRRMAPLIDALYEAISPQLSGTYSFYGHSLGSIIAFEMARRIRREGKAGPACLLVSAHTAPQLGLRRPPLHTLPDNEFKESLRRLAGTPEEVLQDEDLMSIVMQVLRADFEVDETYSYTEEPALECPIAAFGGVDDLDVPRPDLEAWSANTSREFSLHMMEGDHFFVFRSPDFLARLSQELRAHLQEPTKR
ncbi:MAG TPA: thioesterase domain-containing protein [Candidatus Angelobacter sp.]|jgi:surfactin synthase thioesterase subunit